MYNYQEIEKKWQEYWQKNKTFRTENDFSKPKFYALDMFPYPSGDGLHVGHPEGYTANDIVSRYKHAKGFNVLHPMGWDAFGLPAENYAIKEGIHPHITTQKNIATFKRQIQSLGFSYDWEREINTTDPKYYKWTQWIFLKMFEAGLAYEQDLPINYCPSCKTGLANEEVQNNGTCDRCGTGVEKRKLRQWVLAITKYADRLAHDVEDLDWPEGIKDMQRKWIGRSEGCEFEMKKQGDETKSIKVYTTRIDTVFGMTYAVIAPDHENISDFITQEQQHECEKYLLLSKNKSDLDRTGTKEKTGVFSGSYVINPFNGEKVPLYIGDYVLGSYGTGAVMAVPAHDERDFEFAKKMNLPIIESVSEGKQLPYTEDGNLVNSGKFSGLSSSDARFQLAQFAQENGFGEKKVNYKLRDWLFSRQRYWGEPIPLIHISQIDYDLLPRISDVLEATEKDIAYILDKSTTTKRCKNCTCGDVGCVKLIINGKTFSKVYDGLEGKILCDYRLPLELPDIQDFNPAGDGNSPLAKLDDFVNVKLANNLSGKRETNTMPQWGGSCWYYLRYMDSLNTEELVNRDVVNYWGEVDSYVGGAEHAVLHLLYARFWHKFLYDIGVVPTNEPFRKLRNQGMILAYSYQDKNGKLIATDKVQEKDGKYFHTETQEELLSVIAKMSKSLKNVVNPDEIVKEYGADTLRLYEMYMCDFKDSAPWDTKNIIGVKRFLDKVWNLYEEGKRAEDDTTAMKNLHKTLKKVGEDIENYKFNTAIAQMMILVNYGIPADHALQIEWLEKFAIILHPFAPHMAEELWNKVGKDTSIFFASWPEYDENMVKDDTVVIGVQVLGKLRGEVLVHLDESKDEVLARAKEVESVQRWLEGKEIVKEIYVPGKIINIVIK